jgi:hypothetical protein
MHTSFQQYWHDRMLLELFDTKAPQVEWTWNSGYQAWEATVDVGDASYGLMMSSFPWSMGNWNIPAFDASTWTQLRHGCWCFEFVEQQADGSQHHDITGTAGHQAAKVFSIIGAVVVDLLNPKRDNNTHHRRPDPKIFKNICFGGKEANRISLYAQLAPRLAKKLNKRLYKNDRGDHFFLVDDSVPVPNHNK